MCVRASVFYTIPSWAEQVVYANSANESYFSAPYPVDTSARADKRASDKYFLPVYFYTFGKNKRAITFSYTRARVCVISFVNKSDNGLTHAVYTNRPLRLVLRTPFGGKKKRSDGRLSRIRCWRVAVEIYGSYIFNETRTGAAVIYFVKGVNIYSLYVGFKICRDILTR